MPVFEASLSLPRPLTEVFDFFCRPAHIVQLAPPELQMRLVEAPERLQLASRIVMEGRRWGFTQRIASEVTHFEPGIRFIDEQRSGPFRRWVHVHLFEKSGNETRVVDRIEYETPGGALGLLVTGKLIQRDLEWIFGHRVRMLTEILGSPGTAS